MYISHLQLDYGNSNSTVLSGVKLLNFRDFRPIVFAHFSLSCIMLERDLETANSRSPTFQPCDLDLWPFWPVINHIPELFKIFMCTEKKNSFDPRINRFGTDMHAHAHTYTKDSQTSATTSSSLHVLLTWTSIFPHIRQRASLSVIVE